jgi:hypothetical protein
MILPSRICIDNIIIPSKSVDEGLTRLRAVLDKFREHNLTLKLSKCEFFKSRFNYLGREISAAGVKPGNHKIQAVLKMKSPQNVKEVRQFLGLSGYFRKFVKDYARMVEPLTRLTKKSVAWVWSEEQEKAVQQVKSVLTTRPVLAIFDASLATELHTDSSSLGFGSALVQINENGQRCVIAYYSKQTSVEQRNYHSYEFETLAVVLFLRHFRAYLLEIEFKVLTDCSALRTTFSKRDLAELRSKIHQRITKDQKAQKERFDKTRAAATKYVKGQLVMVSNAVSSTGTSKKLLPKFKGPFKIRTVLPNDRYDTTYKVKNRDGG